MPAPRSLQVVPPGGGGGGGAACPAGGTVLAPAPASSRRARLRRPSSQPATASSQPEASGVPAAATGAAPPRAGALPVRAQRLGESRLAATRAAAVTRRNELPAMESPFAPEQTDPPSGWPRVSPGQDEL